MTEKTKETKKAEKGSLDVIQGSFKEKRKSNVPVMPIHLSASSKRWWKKVMSKLDQDVLVSGDAIALMLLCDALAGYERTLKTLREKGETYSSDGVNIERPRPEVEILASYSEMAFEGLREFLLSPDSRKELGE